MWIFQTTTKFGHPVYVNIVTQRSNVLKRVFAIAHSSPMINLNSDSLFPVAYSFFAISSLLLLTLSATGLDCDSKDPSS